MLITEMEFTTKANKRGGICLGVVQRSSQSRWGRLVGRRLPGSRSYRAADVQGWGFSNLY